MSSIRFVPVMLFLSLFAASCVADRLEGESCHNQFECVDDLHCHIEEGEDHGICEAEEEEG
jgi:hypothetical protein